MSEPIKLSLLDNQYLMTPEGFWRIPKAVFLGPIGEVANQIQAAASSIIAGAFMLDGDRPVNAVTAQGITYVGIQLPKIRIATHYKMVTGDVPFLTPVFAATGDTLDMAMDWTPPPDCRVYFGMSVRYMSGAWRMDDCFLFATKPGTPGFFRLPLPNVFSSSSICMGANAAELRDYTLQGICEKLLATFRANPWNMDLLDGNGSRCGQLIRFTADGTTLNYGGDWTEQCIRVSHPALERFIPTPAPTI